MYKQALIEKVAKVTGIKNISRILSDADNFGIRLARGSLKSTLARESEFKEHCEVLDKIIAKLK